MKKQFAPYNSKQRPPWGFPNTRRGKSNVENAKTFFATCPQYSVLSPEQLTAQAYQLLPDLTPDLNPAQIAARINNGARNPAFGELHLQLVWDQDSWSWQVLSSFEAADLVSPTREMARAGQRFLTKLQIFLQGAQAEIAKLSEESQKELRNVFEDEVDTVSFNAKLAEGKVPTLKAAAELLVDGNGNGDSYQPGDEPRLMQKNKK
jgi:hypothetical protein